LSENIKKQEYYELQDKFYHGLRDPYLYLSFVNEQDDYEKIKKLYAILEEQEFIEHKIVEFFPW
jgi:hypothetical protein